MRWIQYAFASLPAAVLGLLCGGGIGMACVQWYRITSFEGASGYFMISIALLGALVGFVTGLIAVGVLHPPIGARYLKAIGWSFAVVLLIGASAAGVSWKFADIPPTIDGRDLMLEVEFKLPVDVTASPAEGVGENVFTLHSVENRTVRKSEEGTLDLRAVRREGNRWVVPAAVRLFTARGSRSIDFMLYGKRMDGFLLPLPGRPGREFLEWSEWGPRPPAPHPPWPDTRVSYRFRLRVIESPADSIADVNEEKEGTDLPPHNADDADAMHGR